MIPCAGPRVRSKALKPFASWIFGTAYVVAALIGAFALAWTASFSDNSARPTPWGVGFMVLLTPLAIAGAVALILRLTDRIPHVGHRALVVLGLAVAGALVFGAQEMISDASACHDDDCLPLAAPVAVACLLGAWSLAGAPWALHRLRYPAPILTAVAFAVLVPLVTSLLVAQWASGRDLAFVDVRVAAVLALWTFPAILAAGAIVLLRPWFSGTSSPAGVHRAAAVLLIVIGCWFMSLTLLVGVEGGAPIVGLESAVPLLIAFTAAPGLVLFVVGLSTFLPDPRDFPRAIDERGVR